MSWTEEDDTELQEYYDRLIKAQKELQAQLRPIQIIISNTTKIQSREVISYSDKRERIVTKIIPKDQWGEDMTDKYRLKIKEECLSKTNELLGE